MAHQSRGFCRYCGKEYTRSGMHRHLSACKDRKSALDSEKGKKPCGYFELLIYGKYNPDYWLVIEVRETATLQELDKFIRDIWVECCGHLSAFVIHGEEYESQPAAGGFWGPPSKGMSYQLKNVISAGMMIGYEYDFGSTTELLIKVEGYRRGVRKDEAITLLSRNHPPKILCCKCRKNEAQWIHPEKIYMEDAFWCEECLKALGNEDMEEDDEAEPYFFEEFYLPVCNSPRMGVCGYDGSRIYPDVFEPDKKSC